MSHLQGRQYLVNDQFTIADIATYPWARAYYTNSKKEGYK